MPLHWFRVLIAAVLATPVAVVLPGGAAHPVACDAAAAHHAAVVVEHGDGTVLTRCVGFGSDSINGYDLLAASGIQFSTVDYGGSLGKAVCQIDSEPRSYPPSCFSNGGSYWAIFASRQNGGWQLTSRGVSNTTLADGDAEGFRYDPQGGSLPAPQRGASGVCPPPSTPPPSTPTQHGATPAPSGVPVTRSGGGASATSPAVQPAASDSPSPPDAAALSPAVAASPGATPASASGVPVTAGAAGGGHPGSAWIAAAATAAGLILLLGWQLVQRRRT